MDLSQTATPLCLAIWGIHFNARIRDGHTFELGLVYA